jgi:hypothetical protein
MAKRYCRSTGWLLHGKAILPEYGLVALWQSDIVCFRICGSLRVGLYVLVMAIAVTLIVVSGGLWAWDPSLPSRLPVAGVRAGDLPSGIVQASY